MARPKIKINWQEFDRLCAMQCTEEEIAAWFRCSVDTIDRACRRELRLGFAELFRQKRKLGYVSLRRAQFQAALQGNPTMLIFLGKHYLGQCEKAELRDKSVLELDSRAETAIEEIRELLRCKAKSDTPVATLSFPSLLGARTCPPLI